MRYFKIASLLLFALSLHPGTMAQTVSGVVSDNKNLPIPGVSVYVDGTTLGTITNAHGEFSLVLKSKVNSPLVIRCLGYETLTLQDYHGNRGIKVQLTPKPYQIKEVVVKKDRFSRKQKMRAFRAQFLGNTRAGRSCKIRNENDISLFYNEGCNTLYASSEKPLIIDNSHLGYTITVHLVEFNAVFSRTSLRNEHLKSSLFLVTSLFEDKGGQNPKFKKRRERSYLGSGLHFFRNLAANKWGETEFLLYNGSHPAIPSQFFTVTDTLDYKKVLIQRNIQLGGVTISTKGGNAAIPFKSTFNLLYRKRRQSQVIFRTNTLYIDKLGLISSPGLVQFGGEIGRKRLGDLLPADYTPNI